MTPLFPYPLYSGGQVRAYNLIKNLAKSHQITLFSFIRPGREQGPIKELEKFCLKVKVFPGRKTWTLRNILLAGFTHLPFTISHFYGDRKVEEALKKELEKEKYDLVHFESFYTSSYLNCASSLPIVMGNENIEYLIYQRFAKQKSFLPLKWLLSFDIWKMRRYEQNAWQKANLNLAVSEVDAQKIEEITKRKCVVVPNGVDFEYFNQLKRPVRLIKAKEPTLLFVGDFKYFANQDALRFLVKKIWPKIGVKLPGVKLWLVGKNPTPFVKSLKSKEIRVDDRIDDIRRAYHSAYILIVPMRVTSGTNIKVLEAMACGLPVVTTSVGAEGIKAKDGKEVIIRNEPEEFAGVVVELLGDKSRRQKLGKAGRALVEKLYDWSKITKRLEKAYLELVYGQKKT